MNKPLLRLPGLIDIHVHLRDPGQTNKEDFYTGTCAALAGGVVTVFDMPNNKEPIIRYELLKEKMQIARKKAICDYGFYFGTDGNNTGEFAKVKDLVVGLKLYLNLTTGELLIENDELVEKIFQAWPKEKLIIIHAENEKVDLALKLAKKYGSRIHITHVASKTDLEQLLEAKKNNPRITCDVTPHHLFLTREILTTLKGFGIVKPPLATTEDQVYLWAHLEDIDCIATDHGPHTIEEKSSDNPPNGLPGLETMLPLLLTAVAEGKITLADVIRLTCTNPRKLFGIPSDSTTYIEVDQDEEYTIENEKLLTKCGWSPFAGWKVKGRVKRVVIRNTIVFEDGKVLAAPGFGRNVLFEVS